MSAAMDAAVPTKILVPVDFGDASSRAIHAAGVLGWRCDASIRLLHAEPADVPAYFTHDQIEAMHAQRERMRAQCDDYLGRFGRKHTSHPFTTVVDEQTPADAILHHAEWADLIVMGTHGRHGPRRWWLGSVAERVLRETDRPLLIIRARDDAEALFKRVLVHASAPLVGGDTLRYARALADRSSGEVVDARYEPIEASLKRTGATLLAVAAPQPRHPAWLSSIGEPLIRFSTVPTLFVPEPQSAAGGAHTQSSGDAS
jgi:nucleotide-binding universal stress UspA family protein